MEKAQENVNLLNRTVLTVPQQAGADGRLFGSVTAQDIATAIREARGLKIDKRNVHMPEPIKNVGTYMVVVEVVERRDRHDQDDGRRKEVVSPRLRTCVRDARFPSDIAESPLRAGQAPALDSPEP